MKTITPINSVIEIHEDFYKRTKQGNIDPDLCFNAYIEDRFSKHITINITRNIVTEEDSEFDLWIDIDICQAEVFAKKLQILIDDRKKIMLQYLNMTDER